MRAAGLDGSYFPLWMTSRLPRPKSESELLGYKAKFYGSKQKTN
jgi:hypothetical protein